MKKEQENIKIIRLKNSEDVIGFVTDLDDSRFKIRTPMIIDVRNSMDNSQSMFVMKSWLPHQLIEDNEAIMFTDDILFMMQPTTEFCNYYEEMIDKLTQLLKMESVLETLGPEQSLAANTQLEYSILQAMDEKGGGMLH